MTNEEISVQLTRMEADIKAIKTGLIHTRFAVQAVLGSLLREGQIPPEIMNAITTDGMLTELPAEKESR